MKKNNYLKTLVKGVITVGSMLAINDTLGYYAPTRTSQTIHRIASNAAGLSIGFLVGQIAGDAVVNSAERSYKAYKGEDIYSEDN